MRCEREDVLSAEPRPDRCQIVHGVAREPTASDVRGVQRSRRRTHQEIGLDVSVSQGLHHADLHGTEAPAAGQHERSRPHRASSLMRKRTQQ